MIHVTKKYNYRHFQELLNIHIQRELQNPSFRESYRTQNMLYDYIKKLIQVLTNWGCPADLLTNGHTSRALPAGIEPATQHHTTQKQNISVNDFRFHTIKEVCQIVNFEYH
jgi:hypothetical protein